MDTAVPFLAPYDPLSGYWRATKQPCSGRNRFGWAWPWERPIRTRESRRV